MKTIQVTLVIANNLWSNYIKTKRKFHGILIKIEKRKFCFSINNSSHILKKGIKSHSLSFKKLNDAKLWKLFYLFLDNVENAENNQQEGSVSFERNDEVASNQDTIARRRRFSSQPTFPEDPLGDFCWFHK